MGEKLEKKLRKAKKKQEREERELRQRQQRLQIAMRRATKIDQALVSLQFTINALADYWENIKQEYIQSSG